MDKTIAGLIGAAALAAPVAAQAEPITAENAMHIASYADLLKPVPNAREVLVALDTRANTKPVTATDPIIMTVQYYHHHHHHHRYYPPYYRPPIYRPAYPPPYYRPPVYHHHHHHHHHHQRFFIR